MIPAWDSVIVHQSDTAEFLKRFVPLLASGDPALEDLILSCARSENRHSDYCIEHRFTTRRELETLIALIADARI